MKANGLKIVLNIQIIEFINDLLLIFNRCFNKNVLENAIYVYHMHYN